MDRDEQIRQWAAEGLSDGEIVSRLRQLDTSAPSAGPVRSFVRGLPGYGTFKKGAEAVTEATLNPLETAKGAYDQFAAGFGNVAMAVPEGLARMYGFGEGADVIGAERERRVAEAGQPEGIVENVARFGGTVAPYAVAGVAAGPNLLRGLAVDMALDVPVAASGREMSLAGMAADMTRPGGDIPTAATPPFGDPTKEAAFQQWYQAKAQQLGLDPNPDNPRHQYDYRAAFEAGAGTEIGSDGLPHWPSEFKLRGHPNLVVDGRLTPTGEPAEGGLLHRAAETVAESPGLRGLTEGAAGLGVGTTLAKGLPAAYRYLRGMGEEGTALGVRAADDIAPPPTPESPIGRDAAQAGDLALNGLNEIGGESPVAEGVEAVADPRMGAAHPALLAPLAGATSGAAVGAATADEGESPVLRGLAGAAAGAGVGIAGLAATKSDRVSGLLKREFTVEGDLPPEVFRSKVAKDSWIGSQESQITFTLRDFRRAVSEEYGQLDDAGLAYVDGVLKGEADPSTLQPRTREAVVRMRNEIDAMSRKLIDSGLVEGEMAARIDENTGVYTTRSYRVFDDPDWAKKVEPEVRNKAKALLRSEYPDLQESEIEGLIENLLYKAEDAPMRLIKGGRLGAKDLSTLKRRKDIAPEIRALWGEYEDPRVNYARSVTKMAHMIGNHQFLGEVREQGLGSFLFDRPVVRDGLEFKAKLAAEGSEVMAPLNGLYTTPEIKRAFETTFGKDGAPEWLQAYYRVNGAIKYAKTVLSLQTHVRNTVGNLGFAVANGHWRASKLADAIGGVATKLGGVDDDAWRDYYRHMQELGVVDQSAHAGELRAALADAGKVSDMEAFSPDTGIFQKAAEGATAAYRAEDDLWKIYAFENERARYGRALEGAAPEEIDRIAAEIVRDTYPTYSMIPQGVRRVRRAPVVGTFVSFPAEVFRVGKNTLRQVAKELADPRLRAIGAERLAGIAAATVAVPSVAIASRHLVGITKDEEDDMRLFLPPWSENSSLVHLTKTEDGKYRYVDLSYTDPYSYLRKPVIAFMRGEDWEAGLMDAVGSAAEPFASEEIGFQHIVDILRNTKKDSGGRVFNPEAPVNEQAVDVLAHLWDAVEPGTISSAQRIASGLQGEVSLYGRSYNPKVEALAVMTGHRVSELDVRQAFSFRARELVDGVRDARSILTSTLSRAGHVGEDEVAHARQDTQHGLTGLYGDLHAISSAAERAGVPRREILSMLNDAGLSQPDARLAYEGGVPSYEPGPQYFRNLARRSRNADEVFARRSMMLEAR